MTMLRKLPASVCLAAAVSMVAMPATAADLPALPYATVASATPLQGKADAVNAEQYRHRDRDYRHRNYRHRDYYRGRRGVNAGDVIAGVLILGGIAAVIDAATKSDDERRYPRDARYRDRADDNRYADERGLDRAVQICRSAIERDVRVENIDTARRTAGGWNVTGTVYNGERFACRINNDGDIADISYGDGFAQVEDNQWDDDRYRAARLELEQDGPYSDATFDDTPDERLPDYPGGPIDGDIRDGDDDGNDTYGG